MGNYCVYVSWRTQPLRRAWLHANQRSYLRPSSQATGACFPKTVLETRGTLQKKVSSTSQNTRFHDTKCAFTCSYTWLFETGLQQHHLERLVGQLGSDGTYLKCSPVVRQKLNPPNKPQRRPLSTEVVEFIFWIWAGGLLVACWVYALELSIAGTMHRRYVYRLFSQN